MNFIHRIREDFQKKVDTINRTTREPMGEETVDRLWTQALAAERNRICRELEKASATMNDWAKGRGIEVMAETKDGYVMLRKTDVAHLACFIEETRREIGG